MRLIPLRDPVVHHTKLLMLAALLSAQAPAAETLLATEPATRSLANKSTRLMLSAGDQARFDQLVKRRPSSSIQQAQQLDKKHPLSFSATHNPPHDSWPGMQLNQHGTARALPRLSDPGDTHGPIPFAGQMILGAPPFSHSPLGRAALWGMQPGAAGYRANGLIR